MTLVPARSNPSISLFSHLRTELGDRFEVFDCTKATLVHVSHTIEDLILRERMPAILLTGFQESGHWRAETERYRALTEIAQQVCIFAGGRPGPESHEREIRVTLIGDDPLRQEWFVCALTPRLSFVLCGQDRNIAAVDEATRQFSTFWTFESEVVAAVLDLLEDVVAYYRPDRLEQLRQAREQIPPAQPDARLVSQLLRELVRFEDQLQRINHEPEARYKIVAELTTDSLYTIHVAEDQRLRYEWMGDGWARLAGYDMPDHAGAEGLVDLAHADDQQRVRARLAALLGGSEDVSEYRIVAPGGDTRWVRDYARPIVDRRSQRVRLIVGAVSDITSQKRDQEALRAERDRFVKIAETVPGVVLSYRLQPDGTFSFPYANANIVSIYGLQPEALTADGSAVAAMWHPDDVALILASIDQSRQQMTPWRSEFRVLNPERGELWIEGHSIPTSEPDGSVVWYGVLTDITERKRVERALQQSHAALEERVNARTAELRCALTRAQALYAITNDAIDSDNLGEAMQRAVERASETIHADRVMMITFDWELRQVEEFLFAGRSPELLYTDVSFDELMSGLSGWAIRERRPAISPKNTADPRESPEVKQRRDELACGSIVVVPLIYLNDVYGTLTAINTPDQPDFSAEDVDLLSAISGQIALAYARRRLNLHLQRTNVALTKEVSERTSLSQRMQQLAEYATAIAMFSRALAEASRELRPLYDTIAETTARLVGGACAVTLLDQDGHALETTAIGHASSVAAAVTRALLTSASAAHAERARQVVQTGQTLEVQDIELPAGASGVIVPLQVHGRILGTLGVFRGRRYTDADLAFLQDLAERAGLAIENARLFSAAALARAEAERANRAKDEFLATMSHELRTPLNAMLGYSESLQEDIYGPLSLRQRGAITAIESAGRHLLTLITDILDLAKIEAERLSLQIQRISLNEVCQSSLLFVREQALKKGLHLSLWLDSPDASCDADPARLKQMLINLLSNAVKFTPDGGAVSLEAVVHADDGLVRFTIHDTGVGIAPDDLGRLFQPFSQVDSSLSRTYEGTGLGLALVRRLAEMHGGSVSVESALGKGSRFTIALPYHAPDAPAEAPSGRPRDTRPTGGAAAQDTRRYRILLAEDNETNIGTLSDYLRGKGFEVFVARDGEEALARAAAVSPHLILMDIQMPRLDGLEAIRMLRAQPGFAATPVIALTALAMPGDEERCRMAGATAYMVKPVSLKGLVGTIDSLLGAQ